jgi:hypothetical protein
LASGSTHFDQPVTPLDQSNDFRQQRFEPRNQCPSASIADPQPNDNRSPFRVLPEPMEKIRFIREVGVWN